MKIKFCGAARHVTGSSHLLTLNDGTNILLDCGLFQGEFEEDLERNGKWHFDPREIDILILSHAHIDHTGRVPKLVKDGFKGKIYATHATRSLSAIMLLDSAMIQEKDAEYSNERAQKRHKNDGKKIKIRQPLYTQKDITPVMNMFTTFGYDNWGHIHKDVKLKFIDAGHILGSAGVLLSINENGKERLFGFTADIGRPDRPILRDPKPLPPVEYMICESTYGDREHESNPEQSERFLEIIKYTCIEKKGKLIIPAFSVGRTQEIVYMLDRMSNENMLPKIKVYVDSPLAVNATEVFGAHPECFDNDLNQYLLIDENPFGFKGLSYIRDVTESKRLNTSNEPCIIISSSGMANAGRVKHHIANNVEDPRNTILIVGYCSPNTPGGKLKSGEPTIRLFGEEKVIRAEIETMDSFSAHGDRKEMFDHIKNQLGHVKTLFLVHGEYETQKLWKKYLEERGFDQIEIPGENQFFELP
ncbi:MAG: MBL fold metallo-hydrolase [Saprospiraceae bacterium]|nr:MBL fold metallo-hydrolase [Saprospiraceae bacterium]